MSKLSIEILALMGAAQDLWDYGRKAYNDGEDPAIVRAQLELHRHAIDLILQRMETQ